MRMRKITGLAPARTLAGGAAAALLALSGTVPGTSVPAAHGVAQETTAFIIHWNGRAWS